MAHVQRKCAECRRTVPTGKRTCPSCGSREGTWVARYRGTDHAERSKTFKRKVDAEAFLSTQEHEKDTGEWIDPERANITLADFWQDQRDRPGKRGTPAATTLAKWDTVFDRYLRAPLGAMPLAAISRQDVKDTVALVPSPWQGAETLKLLRMLLFRAIDDNRLKVNVAARIDSPRAKRKAVRVLRPDEIGRVVEAVPDQWAAFVLLGAYGSLRWSELVAIKRDDVDIPGRTVRIDESCTELNGRFVWGATKTTGSDRVVALPDVVVRALAAHLLRYPPSSEGLVFYGETNEPVRRKTFRPVWLRALKVAGITDHVRPGWLRHSGASLAYHATKDILATAQRLGHTSTRMVDSTYVTLYETVSRQVADAIDEAADRAGNVYAAGRARDQREP
jgi:integrase